MPTIRDGDLGFDVKWGITQTLVADFTVNTDFAQVEDDEQQVNLTRFSLQFPGEARLLPRGRRHVQLRERVERHRRHRRRRRRAGQQPEHEHGAAALLQPAHRSQQRLRGPDCGRRPPARSLRAVAVRRAEHADRRVAGRETRRPPTSAWSGSTTTFSAAAASAPSRRDAIRSPRRCRATSGDANLAYGVDSADQPDQRSQHRRATLAKTTSPGRQRQRSRAIAAGSTGTPIATASRRNISAVGSEFQSGGRLPAPLRRSRRSFGQDALQSAPGLARHPQDLLHRQHRLHHRHHAIVPESKETAGHLPDGSREQRRLERRTSRATTSG